jgi:hypothetical protein
VPAIAPRSLPGFPGRITTNHHAMSMSESTSGAGERQSDHRYAKYPSDHRVFPFRAWNERRSPRAGAAACFSAGGEDN